MQKKPRPVFFAVLRSGEILECSTKKKLGESLAAKKMKDVLFVCRGVKLEPEFKVEPVVKFT